MRRFSVDWRFTGWGVSEDGAFQRMRRFSVDWRFTGWGVSEDGVFQRMGHFTGWAVSRSICKSEDAANPRMRQIKRSGVISRSICKSEDATNKRMRQIKGPGVISRSIYKSNDAENYMIGHFTGNWQKAGWGHFTSGRAFFAHVLRNLFPFFSG